MRLAHGYRDLIAWQKAMGLVRQVYAVSSSWPRSEQIGPIDQIRRFAVSIPSNIAEGNGRSGSRTFRYHLSVAHGSLCEVETQLFIAQDLGYMALETLNESLELSEEVGRVIRGLMKSLEE